MLDGPHPQVPADLAQRAAERGGRLLHRRRFARRLVLLVAFVAVVAFTVWAVRTQPWQVPPAETTPPLDGW
jgi:ferric-dicitrate binding protein FerR (iron transport regulator)